MQNIHSQCEVIIEVIVERWGFGIRHETQNRGMKVENRDGGRSPMVKARFRLV